MDREETPAVVRVMMVVATRQYERPAGALALIDNKATIGGANCTGKGPFFLGGKDKSWWWLKQAI